MTQTYTVILKDERGEFSREFLQPERLPQPGDVYEFTWPVNTLANQHYAVGDRVTIIERTADAPHNRFSSLGNLRIQCRFFTSIWTEFDDAVARGDLKLVSFKE